MTLETYLKEVAKENSEEIAEAMIMDGKNSFEDIARFTKLTLEEVEMIAEELREE